MYLMVVDGSHDVSAALSTFVFEPLLKLEKTHSFTQICFFYQAQVNNGFPWQNFERRVCVMCTADWRLVAAPCVKSTAQPRFAT